MPLYRSMTGQEAIAALNALGYELLITDGTNEALFGLIVALAQEVKALREKVGMMPPNGVGSSAE